MLGQGSYLILGILELWEATKTTRYEQDAIVMISLAFARSFAS